MGDEARSELFARPFCPWQPPAVLAGSSNGSRNQTPSPGGQHCVRHCRSLELPSSLHYFVRPPQQQPPLFCFRSAFSHKSGTRSVLILLKICFSVYHRPPLQVPPQPTPWP